MPLYRLNIEIAEIRADRYSVFGEYASYLLLAHAVRAEDTV